MKCLSEQVFCLTLYVWLLAQGLTLPQHDFLKKLINNYLRTDSRSLAWADIVKLGGRNLDNIISGKPLLLKKPVSTVGLGQKYIFRLTDFKKHPKEDLGIL